MTQPDKRIRPAGNGTDSEITGGRSAHSVATTRDPWALMPRGEWERHLHGYLRGFADGIEHGRRQMEDGRATIQRTAADVVHRLARLPERDAVADREAAERREARWRP